MSDTTLDVRVYPLDDPQGSTKAFASVAMNDIVAIRGIRVVEGEKGLFVTMPQSKNNKTDEYHDIAFPLNGDLRKEVNKSVLDEYKRTKDLEPDERAYIAPEKGSTGDISDVTLKINVYPLQDPQGNTKAFASVSIDNLVAINGIRVVDGQNGLFVTMPQSKNNKTDEYHDVAFPLNGDLRGLLTRGVLEKFENPEKSADQKKTLNDKLAAGAKKAANQTPRPAAAKTHPSVLE